jgi:hypothetical protein
MAFLRSKYASDLEGTQRYYFGTEA